MTFGGEVCSHRKLQVQVNLQDSSKSSEPIINITRKFHKHSLFLLTLRMKKITSNLLFNIAFLIEIFEMH